MRKQEGTRIAPQLLMLQDPLSWMPIRYKLSASYIIICILAFGVGGYLISVSARGSLESEIQERMRWQAQAKATVLERSLELLGRRTEDFASDGYIRREAEEGMDASSEPATRAAALANLAQHLAKNKLPLVPDFSDLRVHDARGRLATSVRGIAPTGPNARLAAISSLTFGEIRVRDGEGCVFEIATPLWSLDRSRQLGTLVSVVDASAWAERILGSVGASDAENVRLTLEDAAGSRIELSRRARAGGDWLQYSYVIPTNGWKLTVELNAHSVLAPVSALQSRFLAAGLITIAAVMLLLFFPMRFLVRPLARMQAAARRLADGDFSARVENHSTDEVGDLARAFNFMAEAVSERTSRLEKAAADLAKRKNELSLEKDRLRTVVQSMHDGLVLLNASGGIELSNDAAAPLVAYLSGREDRVVARRCLSGRSRSLDCAACLLDATGAAQSCTIDIGESVFEIHATRLPSPGGRVLVSRDITQYVTLDERQAHQERLAVLGEVAAVIAHELNNPLAAISMFTQMMERELPEQTPFREHIGVIRRNTDVCKRTIRGLLDYAASAEPDVAEFDLHALTRDAAMFLAPVMKKARVEVAWRLDAESAVVTGVETHIRHVFANLLINAVHAMQPTGGTLTIATRGAEMDDVVVVEIGDTGPGIPPEIRDRIFEPFFSTKPSSSGTGLGLSTSRRIVESVGGSLTLESGAPGGTLFRVSLPRRPAPSRRSWRNLKEIAMDASDGIAAR